MRGLTEKKTEKKKTRKLVTAENLELGGGEGKKVKRRQLEEKTEEVRLW